MIVRPTVSTHTSPLFPYTKLFRDLFLQMIGKAAGELEDGACGRVVADQFRRALPADFDAPEKIGLRPGESVEPGWPEMGGGTDRSEEHTSELQSLMRNSYAVFCLKKTKDNI